MTLEEYKQKCKDLYSIYLHDKNDAAKEYAYSNNPYKVGDKFTDHIGTIIIETIQVYTSEITLNKLKTKTMKAKNSISFAIILWGIVIILISLSSCSLERGANGIKFAKPYGNKCMSSKFIGY